MASTTEQIPTATTATSIQAAMQSTPAPIMTLTKCLIRPYTMADAPAMAREANSTGIARNMRDRFPSPYTLASAESFLTMVLNEPPPAPQLHLAICKPDGTYVGGIGLMPHTDIEARCWEVGYWLGEAHWGQGIASEAAAAFTAWAWRTFGPEEVQRLEAGVFSGNEGSRRVLERAGFTYEGTRKAAIWKNGAVRDQHMYGMVREGI